MPLKAAGEATDLREIDRLDGGVGWIAHPDEGMQRASHALAADGETWVVDPVDAAGVDDLLAEVGTVAGVVVLLDRHTRDAAALATRHGVAVHVPAWMRGVAGAIDAPVEVFRDELAETGYRARPIVNNPLWREAALVGEGTLVVPEAVGTADFFRARGERLGVHPALRVTPPRGRLGDLAPERILVGHGEGVFEDAPGALRAALAGARRRAPALYVAALRAALSG